MSARAIQRIHVIDSHTGGEPTRVVVSGGPDLGGGSAVDKLAVFRDKFDQYRSAIVNEPRGSDVLVGALLLEPADPSCAAGVIFFNNVGYLGMCGHGTIGLIATLAHVGRISPGKHRIETTVGTVSVRLHDSGEVSFQNVASYRLAKGVKVDVEGHGITTGDIAWGGNWFFLVNDHRQTLLLSNVEHLTDFTWRIRQALNREGILGANGQEIDHIELFSPSDQPGVNSKSFVLCPGKAYDRSPCGTGTCAKLACLFADGKLKEGEVWLQESIIGSVFEGSVQLINGEIIPTIKGRSFITGESDLILTSDDPFYWGIRSEERPYGRQE
jgi:4-hydroxyproline epimerase